MKIHLNRIERLLPALLIAPLFASLTACKSTPRPAPADQPRNVGIETTIAHSQQSTDFLEVPARVMADPSHLVHIYPPISGRIFDLRILPGQDVTKGQAIARIQSNDIAVSRADFEKTKIEVMRADRALARGKILLQHEVLSQADYYELEAVDQIAHSELERSRQRIRELGFAEDGTSDEVALRAPISGVVLDIGTATGEMQRSLDNSTSIATIANLDTVWIVGDVFERDLAILKPNREVEIHVPAYPEMKLTGRIANVGNALDPNTHTLKVRIVLANQKHTLKSDMFATIRVPGEVRTAFVLPATAVLHEGEKTFVFLEDSSGKFNQRVVTVGRSIDPGTSGVAKSIEVLTGLNEGDKVVSIGGALLRPTSGE